MAGFRRQVLELAAGVGCRVCLQLLADPVGCPDRLRYSGGPMSCAHRLSTLAAAAVLPRHQPSRAAKAVCSAIVLRCVAPPSAPPPFRSLSSSRDAYVPPTDGVAGMLVPLRQSVLLGVSFFVGCVGSWMAGCPGG